MVYFIVVWKCKTAPTDHIFAYLSQPWIARSVTNQIVAFILERQKIYAKKTFPLSFLYLLFYFPLFYKEMLEYICVYEATEALAA